MYKEYIEGEPNYEDDQIILTLKDPEKMQKSQSSVGGIYGSIFAGRNLLHKW